MVRERVWAVQDRKELKEPVMNLRKGALIHGRVSFVLCCRGGPTGKRTPGLGGKVLVVVGVYICLGVVWSVDMREFALQASLPDDISVRCERGSDAKAEEKQEFKTKNTMDQA